MSTSKNAILSKVREGVSVQGGRLGKLGERLSGAPAPAIEDPNKPQTPACDAGETDGTSEQTCPVCGNAPCTCVGEAPIDKEEPTMADDNKNKNPITTPAGGASAAAPAAPAKISATKEQLEEAFPGEVHREFRLDMREAGVSLIEAKAAMGDRLLKEKSETITAAQQQAEKEKLLGGAGAMRGGAGGSPREAGPGVTLDAKAMAMRMRDPITGRLGKVEGAKTFQDAMAVYMQCGEKEASAHRLATINHPDLWETEQKRLAEQLAASRKANKEKRA